MAGRRWCRTGSFRYSRPELVGSARTGAVLAGAAGVTNSSGFRVRIPCLFKPSSARKTRSEQLARLLIPSSWTEGLQSAAANHPASLPQMSPVKSRRAFQPERETLSVSSGRAGQAAKRTTTEAVIWGPFAGLGLIAHRVGGSQSSASTQYSDAPCAPQRPSRHSISEPGSKPGIVVLAKICICPVGTAVAVPANGRPLSPVASRAAGSPRRHLAAFLDVSGCAGPKNQR